MRASMPRREARQGGQPTPLASPSSTGGVAAHTPTTSAAPQHAAPWARSVARNPMFIIVLAVCTCNVLAFVFFYSVDRALPRGGVSSDTHAAQRLATHNSDFGLRTGGDGMATAQQLTRRQQQASTPDVGDALGKPAGGGAAAGGRTSPSHQQQQQPSQVRRDDIAALQELLAKTRPPPDDAQPPPAGAGPSARGRAGHGSAAAGGRGRGGKADPQTAAKQAREAAAALLAHNRKATDAAMRQAASGGGAAASQQQQQQQLQQAMMTGAVGPVQVQRDTGAAGRGGRAGVDGAAGLALALQQRQQHHAQHHVLTQEEAEALADLRQSSRQWTHRLPAGSAATTSSSSSSSASTPEAQGGSGAGGQQQQDGARHVSQRQREEGGGAEAGGGVTSGGDSGHSRTPPAPPGEVWEEVEVHTTETDPWVEMPDPNITRRQTDWPIWWLAPFFDRTSFGKEAANLVLGMIRSGAVPEEDVWIGTTQGDCNYDVDTSMPLYNFDQLDEANDRWNMSISSIVVCHSLPPFWARPKNKWETCFPCPPVGYTPAITIGRAMAETDIYHEEFVKNCNRMDEVWVPSDFSRDVLIRSGVEASKLRIVPIAVNTTLFNPEGIQPIRLPIGDLVFGRHRRAVPPSPAPTPSISGVLGGPSSQSDASALLSGAIGGGGANMQHLTQLIADAKRKRQEQVLQEQQQQQQAARESQRQRQEAAAAGAGGGGGEWGNRKALAGGGKGGFSSASRRLLASFSSVSDGWSAYSPAHGGPSPGSGPGDKHQEEEEGDERAGQPIMLLSCFKWEMRKGWDVLLAAYLQEFTSEDNVELYILTKPFLTGGDFKGDMRTWARDHLNLTEERRERLPSLYVISHHLSDEEYAGLYKAADAFVIATRGEGWGMPISEAMAMGLPVVVTNWSGVTAFVDETTGYMVDYDLTEVPDDQPWWFLGARWATAKVDSMRARLREVVRDRREAAARGRRARQRMVELYSPEALGRQLGKEFDRLKALLRSGECGSKCHNKTWVAPLGDRNPELYSGTEPFMTNRRHGTAGLSNANLLLDTGFQFHNINLGGLQGLGTATSTQRAEAWRKIIASVAAQSATTARASSQSAAALLAERVKQEAEQEVVQFVEQQQQELQHQEQQEQQDHGQQQHQHRTQHQQGQQEKQQEKQDQEKQEQQADLQQQQQQGEVEDAEGGQGEGGQAEAADGGGEAGDAASATGGTAAGGGAVSKRWLLPQRSRRQRDAATAAGDGAAGAAADADAGEADAADGADGDGDVLEVVGEVAGVPAGHYTEHLSLTEQAALKAQALMEWRQRQQRQTVKRRRRQVVAQLRGGLA